MVHGLSGLKVKISGTVAMTSTLLGPQSATMTLKCDSSNPPTTVVDVQPVALSGVGASATLAWGLGTYEVPAGHYYLVDQGTPSANATPAIVHINETPG